MRELIPGLTHVPVKVTCRPTTHVRTYTTDPPRYRPFAVWSWSWVWEFRADEPVQKVELLFGRDTLAWARGARRDANVEVEHHLTVAPTDPAQADSDALRLSVPLGDIVVINDPALMRAPQEILNTRYVTTHLSPNTTIQTGVVIDVVSLEATEPQCSSILLVAARDTANARNGRWRLRPRLTPALPEPWSILGLGRRRGTIHLKEDEPPAIERI